MASNGSGLGMVIGVGVVAGVGLFLWSRRSSGMSLGSPRDRVSIPSDPLPAVPASVEAWLPYVDKLAPGLGLDPATVRPFVRAWLTVESGGNPCSVGHPADGALESGPFQFMAPHDVAEAGTTVADMRANCAIPMPHFPGLTRHSPQSEIDAARKQAEAQARPLTEDEKVRHMTAGLQYIAHAAHLVEATGVGWKQSNPGYWALVKSHHSGASWPAAGVSTAAQGLGHMPADWDELVRGVRASRVYQSSPKAKDTIETILANAGKTMKLAFPGS